MRFPRGATIKKQRHFLIVTSEKSGFAKYLTCSASLDQKLPVFFDPNLKPQTKFRMAASCTDDGAYPQAPHPPEAI